MSDTPHPDSFAEDFTDNPYWNENGWFSLSIPERGLHGIVHFFFRPNMKLLVGGPVLWDRSGLQQSTCLHYDWAHLQAEPEAARKFDFKARNSLSVKVLVPLERYKIDYAKDGVEIDLLWEAVGPVHRLETGDSEQAKTAAYHFEQPGRMRGSIRRYGEELAVDCWSMRDGSSGPYDTEKWPTGGYFWGIGPSGSFNTLTIGSQAETDTMGGFLLRDGEMAALEAGKRTVLEYGRHGPSRVRFEAVDTIGRTIAADGFIDPGFVHTGYTDHTIVWSLVNWEIDADGRSESWLGDNQEFYPAAKFRLIARGERQLG